MIARGLKGLVFDKDGCLFDFNATWGAFTRGLLIAETKSTPEALVPLAEALGYDLERGTFRKGSLVIAGTADEVVEASLPFLPNTTADAFLGRLKSAAATAPQVEVTPLAALFTTLRNAGLTLGIATNDGEAPARANLESVHVVRYFDFFAGYDSGYGAKPEAGQLLGFCETTGLTPQVCAMIGDSTHDLHAGRAAGMTTVGVLTGVAEREDLAPYADVVLGSIAELPAWLGLSD